MHRYGQHLRGFLSRHSSEVAHFNQPCQRFVFSRKRLDRAIQLNQLQQFDAALAFHFQAGYRDRSAVTGGSFLGRSAACVIDQHLSHHPGGNRQKMHFVGEALGTPGEQLEISLMDQRGRLQRMIAPLSKQMAGRNPMQLIVQGGQKIVQRGLISRTQSGQQIGNRSSTHVSKGIMRPCAAYDGAP